MKLMTHDCACVHVCVCACVCVLLRPTTSSCVLLYVWLGGDGLMEGRGGDHYAELLANNRWRRANLARTNPLATTVGLLWPP